MDVHCFLRARARSGAALLLLTACVTPRRAEQTARSTDVVLAHVNVVDVESGTVTPDQSVLIQGSHIRSVGNAHESLSPRGAVIVDATDKFVIPGLWDMHTHLTVAGESVLPLLVANGVTAVRDMGADSLEQLQRWRAQLSTGQVVGPLIVAAGPILDNPPPEPLGTMRLRVRVANAEQGRRVVDSLVDARVDFIKVYRSLPRDAYFAIAEESKRLGIRFAGHLPTAITLLEASNAGQWTIEHALEVPFPRDSAVAARTFAAMRANGTWFTPNLIGAERIARMADSVVLNDPRRRYLSPELAEFWQFILGAVPRDVDPALFAAGFASALRSVGSLRQAGIPLLAGTDLGFIHVYPGSSVHEELQLLVRAGLTAREALATATINPARALAATDTLGAIKPGQRADILLLDANPLDDIRNTQRIHGVVLNGRYLSRRSLDDLLRDAERGARPSRR